jgi:hypothetical protein
MSDQPEKIFYTAAELDDYFQRLVENDRKHPIRTFLRRLPYRLKSWWYEEVSSRVFPRQRWLKIPRTWVDPDSLMETVVAQSLVNFWENDDGEKTLRFQGEEGAWDDPNAPWTKEQAEECRLQRKAIYEEMKAAYDWIKSKKHHWYEVTENEEGQKHLEAVWKHRHYLWS